MMLYPLLFQSNLRPMVWGGNRIRPYKGLDATDEPIGESWEVSTYPTLPSEISNGAFAGKKLASVVEEYPEAILGKEVNKKYKGKLPLLVKFIDAKTDLSIQVHPNDEMAMREHEGRGKTEMWYVIKADEGGKLYSGFKKQITLEEYRQRIADGTITEVLAEHYVKPGDVFYIPAGRVHAICGGVLLAEVQQSSDLTYRIYDYNRPGLDGKPRELHTELASKALNYHVEDNYRTDYKDELNKANKVISSPYFDIRVMELTKPMHRNMLKYDSFVISMCFEGDCKIRVRSTGDEIILKEGNSTLIPAAIADYDIIPLTAKTRILDSFINNMEKDIVHRIKRSFTYRRRSRRVLSYKD